jgi:hypothetical protein
MNQRSRLRGIFRRVLVLAVAAALVGSRVEAAAPPPPPADSEADLFARMLTQAKQTSAEGWPKAVRKDLTYAHLVNDGGDYRGAILHVVGRLKRISRLAGSRLAGQIAGELFEAWVFPENLGTNPYCVVFSEWPADLPRELLGEKIEGEYRVALNGSFFKSFRYKVRGDGGNRNRSAPLVIARSLSVLDSPNASRDEIDESLSWLRASLVGGLGSLFMPVLGLTWWFRRTDNRVRRWLLSHTPDFALPPPGAPCVATGGPPSRWLFGFRRLFPRITPKTGSDRQPGRPSSLSEGGKRRSLDKPPDEGAGSRPRP